MAGGPPTHTIVSHAPRLARLFLVLGALALLSFSPATPQAGAAQKGIVDYRLELSSSLDDQQVAAMVEELGAERLGARWTRVTVFWRRLQPSAPGGPAAGDDADGDGYSDAYVAQLDRVVAGLHDAGLRLIFTASGVPSWASDSRYWPEGHYEPRVAMRIHDPLVRREFTAFGRFLASRYGYAVRHFEVWNEPNLGSGLFPQRVGKRLVAPPVYLEMVKAFAAGARAGADGVTIIAGATAPRGSNDKYSTSPQVFAHYLAKHEAGAWFDAYSHHPYTPRRSRNASPNLPPNDPSRCVTLYNLKTLLEEFPRKPFYLTEFAYNTQYSEICGLHVSYQDQARYLREAYKRVRRWPQVKVMLWFLVTDWAPDPARPAYAMYLGLVEADGVTRKPGWYAFAGGNRIAVTAPARSGRGELVPLDGTLTTKLGGPEGVVVTLQSRTASGAWARRAAVRTGPAGEFHFELSQVRTRTHRVVWDGVVESAPFTVFTP